MDAVLGALVGAGFFYLAWAVYYLVRKQHGLGFGDIALMGMSGAFLGLKLVVLVIVLAPVSAIFYVVVSSGAGGVQLTRRSGYRRRGCAAFPGSRNSLRRVSRRVFDVCDFCRGGPMDVVFGVVSKPTPGAVEPTPVLRTRSATCFK